MELLARSQRISPVRICSNLTYIPDFYIHNIIFLNLKHLLATYSSDRPPLFYCNPYMIRFNKPTINTLHVRLIPMIIKLQFPLRIRQTNLKQPQKLRDKFTHRRHRKISSNTRP